MPEDPISNLTREIFSALPLKEFYADAISPGAKVTGQIVEDVMKAIQIALAPVQLAGVAQDKFRRLIDRARTPIPETRQILPAPQIIGPVLEGIRYEVEGSEIESMFAELLSRAMDKDQVQEAHPAFVETIKLLAPDETVIIKEIKTRHINRVWIKQYDEARNWFSDAVDESHDIPTDRFMFPENYDLYFDHLQRMGLILSYVPKSNEYLFDESTGKRRQIGVREFVSYRLSSWGNSFAQACLPNNGENKS